MHISRLRCGLAIPYVLTFTLYVAVCGCDRGIDSARRGKDSFACGDQTVTVVLGDGTRPKDVYLCQGDKLTWKPDGHTFLVTFPNKYPFEGSPTSFRNNPQNPNSPVGSPPAKHIASLAVYHYTITIDGKEVVDPQVVGGGAHSN